MKKLQNLGWVWTGDEEAESVNEEEQSPPPSIEEEEQSLPLHEEVPISKAKKSSKKSSHVKYCTWCSQDNDISAVHCECCGNDTFRENR